MIDNNAVFLLDANAFITPYRRYYAFDLVPAYWSAIDPFVNSGTISVLDSVKNELNRNDDPLSKWLFSRNLRIIKHNDDETVNKYGLVINYINTCGFYTSNGVRSWAEGSAADPWLIASAAANGFILVTVESKVALLSKKSPTSKIKIPDVARHFNVETIDVFEMMRRLEIKINT